MVGDIVSDHLNFKGSTIGAIQHWPGHCKILTIDWSFRGGTEVGSKVNHIIHGLIICLCSSSGGMEKVSQSF